MKRYKCKGCKYFYRKGRKGKYLCKKEGLPIIEIKECSKDEYRDKFILDACCGIKSMWIQKNNKNTIYIDIRKEPKKHFEGDLFGMKQIKGFLPIRQNREINPDLIADFRNLPFLNNQFKLIVWDPPHLKGKISKTDMITASYGSLNPETWQDDLKKGFKELWRCLDNHGILIFKFNNNQIPFKKVLSLFPQKALFGTTSNNRKNSITRWFCFMKIPEKN